jgi:hypothetical protein
MTHAVLGYVLHTPITDAHEGGSGAVTWGRARWTNVEPRNPGRVVRISTIV